MPDLTTLAEVKSWRGIPSGTTTADSLLSSLISATSADFLRAIERPDLMSEEYTEQRTGDGSRRLVLRHWPITAVGSLVVGGVTIAAAGGSPGWYIDTSADPERQFVLYLSGPLVFTDGAAVPVTYTAGYVEVPDDIGQAVTEWVVFRYARKSSTGTTQARSVEGENAHFEEFDIPPNTKRVIAAYKRKFPAYGVDPADSGIGADGAAPQNSRGQRNGPGR